MLLYSRRIAGSGDHPDWPIYDIAIFEYPGDKEGVDLANSSELGDSKFAMALGYPINFVDIWSKNLIPLVSFGTAYNKVDEMENVPFLKEQFTNYFVDRIFFTGITLGGNSGGGLYNSYGELMGICRGYDRYDMHQIFPPTIFYSVRTIFECVMPNLRPL